MQTPPSAAGLPTCPHASICCRVTRDIYPPLDTTGARLFGGRFNPVGIPALYLASDPDLALRESTHSASWARFTPFAPRRIVCVRVLLSSVVDLLDPNVLRAARLGRAVFEDSWADKPEPTPGQLFGEATLLLGIEAIRYPSALDPARHNIVVFPDNLREGSLLEVCETDAG